MKLIENIDNYFYSKPLKDTLMFYLLLVVVIGFIGFYFVLPYAQKYRDTQFKQFQNSKNTLQSLIVKNNIFNTKIYSLKKRVKKLTLKKITLKKQKDFYDELVDLLDFTKFNKYKWGKFVKNLVLNAKKEGLHVLGFTNKIFATNNKGVINKKMEINVKLNGEYKNLIYFIYRYENLKDLLRVEGININKKNIYNIKFTLYGYEK